MATSSLEAANYTRLPNFSVRSAISIASALLALDPPAETDAVRRAKRRLKERAENAKEKLARRAPKGAAPASEAPAIDLAADRAWSALRLRLEGYAVLPSEKNPRVAKARALLESLFGDEGLSFVNLPYAEQSTATATILARIDAQELQRELEEVAGKEFVAMVRTVQPKYEAMVQEFLARDEQNEDLRPVQAGMQSALTQYAVAVLGAIDPENEAHVKAVRIALAPLANQKAAVLRSSKPSADPEEGEPNTEPNP